MNIFHSLLIRYGRGGGSRMGRRRSVITFRFFFITVQICLSRRVAGLLILLSPKP